jgi:ABC-2 type transport system ATP-binding protein
MNMAPAIHLDRVSKSYVIWRRLRRRLGRGIHGVSLTVPRGVIFGLLGLNGAGKTTTMKLLVGLLRPDAGTVRVLDGEPGEPATRARIGFLPELPYLPLQLDARTLLTAYGRMSGLSGRHLGNRIDAVLEGTGLRGRDREPLREFSKGMLQRAAMAQVMLHEPEIVFADEPLSGLDPLGIREMRDLLLGLKAAGLTVVLNSHQIAEVERVCDQVGVMAAGRLVRVAEPKALTAAMRARTFEEALLETIRRAG